MNVLLKKLLTSLNQNKEFAAGLMFLIVISYFVVFHNLDRLTLRTWDESCYLINAKKMIEKPSVFLVYNYYDEPDVFSPKPPLYVWFSAISYKLIPNNPELAIRMPSALFALLSIFLLYFFGYYYLKSFWAGIFSAVILLSSVGFFQWHIARTGDTDTMFVFWSLVTCFSFFIYTIEFGKKKRLALIIFGLGILLVTFTKGPAIILFLPAFILWMLLSKNLVATIKDPMFWIIISSVISIIFYWYYRREQLNPGFLQAVWKQELRGRFEVVEQQPYTSNPAIYFFNRMFEGQFFIPWILYLFPLLFVIAKKEKTVSIQFIKFILLVWIQCVFSISGSKSIKDWYDAIWYPLMALLIGVSLSELILRWPYSAKKIMLFSILLSSCWPLYSIVKKNMMEPETAHLKPFLKSLREGPYKSNKLFVYDLDFNSAIFFYIEDNQEKGYDTNLWHTNLDFMPDSIDVITTNWNREEEILNTFNVKFIEMYEECKLFHLIGRKQKPKHPK